MRTDTRPGALSYCRFKRTGMFKSITVRKTRQTFGPGDINMNDEPISRVCVVLSVVTLATCDDLGRMSVSAEACYVIFEDNVFWIRNSWDNSREELLILKNCLA